MFIGSRSSFTSELINIKSKSSISEELMGKFNISRKDMIENGNGQGPGGTGAEKVFRNEFTLFNKLTNIFTEPIKEIALEENTNKTNKTTQTIDFEESPSPIHGLMAELKAESPPMKPSKKF